MYSRNFSGDAEPRTFGVSGMLWHGVLVMYDRESDSLWTQLDGRAIFGTRSGHRLEHLPSAFVPWRDWVALHPDTQVLEKPDDVREQAESRYASYLADPEQLFFEHLTEGLQAIGPKDVVFGVVVDGEPLAVAEGLLVERGTLLVQVGSVPVLFLRDPGTGLVDAVDARLGGDPHHLLLPDGEGGLGTAHPQALQDPDAVRPLRVDRAFWYAWARSHPGSSILTRNRRDG